MKIKTATRLRILVTLYRYGCVLHHNDLARLLDVSERAVIVALNRLEVNDLIETGGFGFVEAGKVRMTDRTAWLTIKGRELLEVIEQ